MHTKLTQNCPKKLKKKSFNRQKEFEKWEKKLKLTVNLFGKHKKIFYYFFKLIEKVKKI